MGQSGGTRRGGGLGGPASGPSSGRAESAERGAGRGVALPNRPRLSRSVRFILCAVDAPGGAGADRTRDRGLADPAGGRPLSAGLGFHRPAASAASHRAAGGGGPGLGGEDLFRGFPPNPSAKARKTM